MGVGKWAVIVAKPHIEVQAPWELVVNWDPSHKLGPCHTPGRAPRLVGVHPGLV